MTIKLDRTRAAAVNHAVRWIPVSEQAPPMGCKLLLVNDRYGVATIGRYSPDGGFSHWQALPKFKDKE